MLGSPASTRNFEQNVGMCESDRGLEPSELNQLSQGIVEVNRVHKASILDPAVIDSTFVQALDRLVECRLREREGEMVHAARNLRPRVARQACAPRS